MRSDSEFIAEVIISVTFVLLCAMVFYYMANIILNQYGIENDNAPVEMAIAHLYVTSLPGNMTVKVPLGLEPIFEYRVVNGFYNNYAYSYGYCMNESLERSLIRSVVNALGFDVVVGILDLTGTIENLPQPVQDVIYYTYPDLAIKAIRVGKGVATRVSGVASKLKSYWHIYEEIGPEAEKIVGKLAAKSALIYARMGAKITLNALEKISLIGIAVAGIYSFTEDYLSVVLFKDRQCLYGAHGTSFEKYTNIDEWKFYPNKLFNIQATGSCVNNNTGSDDLVKCRVDPKYDNKVLAEIVLEKIEILDNRSEHNLTLIYKGVVTEPFTKIP